MSSLIPKESTRKHQPRKPKYFICANEHRTEERGESVVETSDKPWRRCPVCGLPMRLEKPAKRVRAEKAVTPEWYKPSEEKKSKSCIAIVNKLVRTVNRIIRKETPKLDKWSPKLFDKVGKRVKLGESGVQLFVKRPIDLPGKYVTAVCFGDKIELEFFGCVGYSCWFRAAAKKNKVEIKTTYFDKRDEDPNFRHLKVKLPKVKKPKVTKEKKVKLTAEDLAKPESFLWMTK